MAGLRVALTLEQCWHRVPGGTAVAALGLAAALAARPDVDPVGVAARHRRPPAGPWRPPVAVRQLPLPRLALYEAWHRWRRPAVEVATGPVDVVHATTIVQPGHRAPLVVTVHDLAFRHDPSHFTAQGRRVFERGLALAVGEAAAVLCSSEATRRDCLDAGFDGDRLRVVPLGPGPGLERPVGPAAVDEARRRHGLDRPYVLWAGTAEPRKNLAGLLDAWRRLGRGGTDLVLAGPEGWGDDGADPAAVPAVRRTGFVPAADLAALYAGAAVVCYPSLTEGFGLPVLEAMVQGAPVVTSAGTATEELVAGGAGVAVDPRDTDALAGALAALLDDPAAARRLGEAGRARAAAYTWDRAAALTVEAYRCASA